jgi:hypothetical protein
MWGSTQELSGVDDSLRRKPRHHEDVKTARFSRPRLGEIADPIRVRAGASSRIYGSSRPLRIQREPLMLPTRGRSREQGPGFNFGRTGEDRAPPCLGNPPLSRVTRWAHGAGRVRHRLQDALPRVQLQSDPCKQPSVLRRHGRLHSDVLTNA